MAISTTTLDDRFANKVIQDTDIDETPTVAITGKSSGSVYFVQLTSGATSQTNYFKIFDAGEITLGTTLPIFQLRIPASTTINCIISAGMNYSTALTMACQQGQGTSGTSGPTGATVTARLVAS